MTCNVERYLPDDDSEVPSIERLVHQPHLEAIVLSPGSQRTRHRFRPPNNVKLEVFGRQGLTMWLIGYSNSGGDVVIELKHQDRTLRKLHTHDGHHNPDRKLVEGAHIHFPSRKYPLSQNGSSYAYGLETTIESLVDWLLYFCDRMDISMLNGIQTYLSDR